MKRFLRRMIKSLGICLILLGLLALSANVFSVRRYYQYHVLDATPTQNERYAYADSHLVRFGVIDGNIGGFYRKSTVGRGGGPEKVITNGWFPQHRPLLPGEMMGIPVDLTVNSTGNRINLTVNEMKVIGEHPAHNSILLPLWLCSLLGFVAGSVLLWLTRRKSQA